jgi:translation initiation factor 1
MLSDVCLPDPFSDEESIKVKNLSLSTSSKNMVHIRIQQRNGTKHITTVSGLSDKLDFKKLVKALKKIYACNGTVLEDHSEKIIQLQGDHREAVRIFLIKEEICELKDIQVHGF